MTGEKITDLVMMKKELEIVKDAVNILTKSIKCNEVFYPDDIEEVLKSKPTVKTEKLSEEQVREVCQQLLSSKSALVSYANVGKKSEIDKKPDEKQFNDEIQVIHFNESPTLEAIELLYETHPECVNIDFEELSKVKELSPDLQLLFKDSLKWDVVIHNTFNIEESILSELLRNMSKQDVSFICSNHNISDNFITKNPNLIDWNALLTFNQVPSEKVLIECYRYIPKRYKKTAYKQLICKQIFESKRSDVDDEEQI